MHIDIMPSSIKGSPLADQGPLHVSHFLEAFDILSGPTLYNAFLKGVPSVKKYTFKV